MYCGIFFFSTVSSGLNSLAAVVLEDIIKPINKTRNTELPDHRAAVYTKFLGKSFVLSHSFSQSLPYSGLRH